MRALMFGAAMAAGLNASLALAQQDDFYRGKRIDLVVGGNAGGVYDVVARSVARNMPAQINGAPQITVQYMPGAGSIKAAEWLSKAAAKDGTVFAALYPGAILQTLFDTERQFHFDPAKLGWIGSADSGARMCVTYHASRFRSLADARNQEMIIGASAPGGSTWDYAWMMKNLSGAKIKVVPGYKGTPELALAMERGEIDGICGYGLAALRSEKPDWFRDRKLNFLVQFSLTPDAELTALGAPMIWDFISGDARKAVELVLSQQSFARPYAAPPGLPPARLAALREAFQLAIASPQMKEEFEKMGSPLTPLSGADLAAAITKIFSAPKPIIELARKAQQPPE